MRCRYVTTDPVTFDFEQICSNEGDGVHGFCGVHEAVIEDKVRERWGDDAVTKYRAGASGYQSGSVFSVQAPTK